MRDLIAGFFSAQQMPDTSPDGLPYWIFWLLVFAIFLLLTFIFLRDKDLRRRLDGFFKGIKNQLKKVRLQHILKKERHKQEAFLSELGQKAWDEDVTIPHANHAQDELARLEKQKGDLQDKQTDYEAHIFDLNKDLEVFQKKQETELLKLESAAKPYLDKLSEIKVQEKELDKRLSDSRSAINTAAKDREAARKEIGKLDEKTDLLEDVKTSMEETLKEKIGSLETKKSEAEQLLSRLTEEKASLEKDAKAQQKQADVFAKKIKKNKDATKNEVRKLEKDIKEWEKKRDEVAAQIKEIEEKKIPLYYQLGKLIDEERVEHEELEIFYSKLDKTKTRTRELEDRIKDLEP
ncbi:MAG: hypothetical protein GQ544_03175 [Candidatus Aminicenantes bacterium]|nr:hypothetical protein [Candidatus Aminicenantes bacterium]